MWLIVKLKEFLASLIKTPEFMHIYTEQKT